MKAQEHGNVSAKETNRRTPQINSRCVLFSLLSLLSIAVIGCYYPPKDNNKNLPQDAVRNFIKLVKAEDYEAARNLWYGASKLIATQEKFEDFCSRYKNIDLDKCQISKAGRGKSGFSIVDVDWEENGQKKHTNFGLKIIDGKWKMERGYYW